MKRSAPAATIAAAALLLAACGGGEDQPAGQAVDAPQAGQAVAVQTPAYTQGQIIGYGPVDSIVSEPEQQLHGVATIRTEDQYGDDSYYVAHATGMSAPIDTQVFSDVERIVAVTPDLALVDGDYEGEHGTFGLDMNSGLVTYSIPRATDSWPVIAGGHMVLGDETDGTCEQQRVYDVETGQPASWSWPAEAAGECAHSTAGDDEFFVTNEEHRIDAETGAVSAPQPEDDKPFSIKATGRTLKYDGWTATGVATDGQTDWRPMFDRLALRGGENHNQFTVLDSTDGTVLYSFDSHQLLPSQDDCELQGFLAADRLLLSCEAIDDDDVETVYVVAV